MKQKIKKILRFLLNPRLLLCLGLAWMITNGWSYILFAIGTACGIEWMAAVGGGYMALLWVPATPEKLITCAIAIFLLKKLFPNDEKTLGVLRDLRKKVQAAWQARKNKRSKNKNHSH